MKKNVIITGANGMLAKKLAKDLEANYSVRFLTRNPVKENEFLWDINSKYIDKKVFKDVHYIIHLAGASIADKRWSKKRKASIKSSRTESAQLLLDEVKNNNILLDGFISASAIGFYGTKTSETIFTEESPAGNDYLSNVCKAWEEKANLFYSKNLAKRIAIVRIGIIFSKNGGALQKMMKPIKLWFGAALGKGNQYMPWIHIEDLCGIFKHILDDEKIKGTFNGVAPEHITNAELTKAIGVSINKKILLPNIPSFVLKLIFGKMAIILLEGSRISSKKIESLGYKFKFTSVKNALDQLKK